MYIVIVRECDAPTCAYINRITCMVSIRHTFFGVLFIPFVYLLSKCHHFMFVRRAKALVQTIATIRRHQFTARNRAFHFISNFLRRSRLLTLPQLSFPTVCAHRRGKWKTKSRKRCRTFPHPHVARCSAFGKWREWETGLHLPMKSRFGCVIFDARELHAGHTIGSTGSLSLTRSDEGNEKANARLRINSAGWFIFLFIFFHCRFGAILINCMIK